jgi:hypothetical protein
MDCTGEFNYYKMKKLIGKSKIYVDFEIIQEKTGYLEAAINGCVVITNRKGSANNSIDLSINDEYKFEDPIKEKKLLKYGR